MKLFRPLHACCVLAAATCLVGCVEHVDEILANQQDFLNSGFSAASLDPQIASAITQADPGAVAAYTRIEFSSIPVSAKTGLPGGSRLKVSLRNEGNGLSSRVTQTLKDGVPLSQFYELTYRGYLGLRWNRVALYEEVAPLIWQVRRFDRFDPFQPGGSTDLHYDYVTGSSGMGHSSWEHDQCAVGGQSAAADLNPALAGDAIILDCDYHNQRYAPMKKEWAYLTRYGVAVQVSEDYNSGKVLYPIRDLKIE